MLQVARFKTDSELDEANKFLLEHKEILGNSIGKDYMIFFYESSTMKEKKIAEYKSQIEQGNILIAEMNANTIRIYADIEDHKNNLEVIVSSQKSKEQYDQTKKLEDQINVKQQALDQMYNSILIATEENKRLATNIEALKGE